MRNSPKIVYKYRSWEDKNHKRVLLNNELYFASPKEFDDPFDCRIPPNFSLLSEAEMDNYITDMLVKHIAEKIDSRSVNLNVIIPDFEKRMRNIKESQKSYAKMFFADQDTYYGVLSLAWRWNRIPMWARYGNFHKGYCIGFYEEELRKSMKTNHGAAKSVKYSNKFPEIKPIVFKDPNDQEIIDRLFIQYFYKSNAWRYEKEFRIITNYFPKVPTLQDRLLTFSDDAIKEVILGIDILPKEKEEIIENCHTRKIPVFQAEKVDFKFTIEKNEIK